MIFISKRMWLLISFPVKPVGLNSHLKTKHGCTRQTSYFKRVNRFVSWLFCLNCFDSFELNIISKLSQVKFMQWMRTSDKCTEISLITRSHQLSPSWLAQPSRYLKAQNPTLNFGPRAFFVSCESWFSRTGGRDHCLSPMQAWVLFAGKQEPGGLGHSASWCYGRDSLWTTQTSCRLLSRSLKLTCWFHDVPPPYTLLHTQFDSRDITFNVWGQTHMACFHVCFTP